MDGPELRDIHLPDAVPWWPPAPGWWLLLAILLVALAIGIRWYRWRRSTKRRTLGELRRLRGEWHAGLDDREAVDRVAALLRRVLISYRGRRGFAASSGEGWIAQLGELGRLDAETLRWLGEARYRPGRPCDPERLLDASERWLKSLPWEGRRVSA